MTWQNQYHECAPSEDSDQPGHPPSLMPRLIWVFAWCRSFCWFCQVTAHLYTEDFCTRTGITLYSYVYEQEDIIYIQRISVPGSGLHSIRMSMNKKTLFVYREFLYQDQYYTLSLCLWTRRHYLYTENFCTRIDIALYSYVYEQEDIICIQRIFVSGPVLHSIHMSMNKKTLFVYRQFLYQDQYYTLSLCLWTRRHYLVYRGFLYQDRYYTLFLCLRTRGHYLYTENFCTRTGITLYPHVYEQKDIICIQRISVPGPVLYFISMSMNKTLTLA